MSNHRSETLSAPGSKYSASLTFRGFEMPPEQVETLVGVKASALLSRGFCRKAGTRPLIRSFVQYEIFFDDTTNLFEMLPSLLSHVGGVEHLSKVLQKVSPEFLDVNIFLRVKNSENQEGGFIDTATLEGLAKLGATLSFEFAGAPNG